MRVLRHLFHLREGPLLRGLAVVRTVPPTYHTTLRNPHCIFHAYDLLLHFLEAPASQLSASIVLSRICECLCSTVVAAFSQAASRLSFPPRHCTDKHFGKHSSMFCVDFLTVAESSGLSRRPCAAIEQIHNGSSRERLVLSRLAPCTCAADLPGDDVVQDLYDEEGSEGVGVGVGVLGGLHEEVLRRRSSFLLSLPRDGSNVGSTLRSEVLSTLTDAPVSALSPSSSFLSPSSSSSVAGERQYPDDKYDEDTASVISRYPHTDQPSFRRYLADHASELLLKAAAKPEMLPTRQEPLMVRDALPVTLGCEQP
jgi:hypothetical protein